MSDVTDLPLSRARATEIVREIAKDSRRWSVNIPYKSAQMWRELVNRRQVERCLLDGYMLEDRARLDEHGNWRMSFARVCGGVDVVIEIALQRNPVLPSLFVVGMKGDEINI